MPTRAIRCVRLRSLTADHETRSQKSTSRQRRIATTRCWIKRASIHKPIHQILKRPLPPALVRGDVAVGEECRRTDYDSVHVHGKSVGAAAVGHCACAFATADAGAAAGSDYIAPIGSVSFLPGVTTRNITVSVLVDAVLESDETFAVDLIGAVNAVLGDDLGVGTIVNDD